jgi:hypothetical protein
MTNVITKTAIAIVGITALGMVASYESLYRNLKSYAPGLSRKETLLAFYRTIETATNYRNLTGEMMSQDRVVAVYKDHTKDILAQK